MQPLRDNLVGRVELTRARVSVDRVTDLVIAALIERAEVKPYFGYVRVDANGTRIGVESIAVLVDLEVKDADRTPESRVAAVAVHCLLISFIRLVVLLASHVSTTKKVPTLRIRRIRL